MKPAERLLASEELPERYTLTAEGGETVAHIAVPHNGPVEVRPMGSPPFVFEVKAEPSGLNVRAIRGAEVIATYRGRHLSGGGRLHLGSNLYRLRYRAFLPFRLRLQTSRRRTILDARSPIRNEIEVSMQPRDDAGESQLLLSFAAACAVLEEQSRQIGGPLRSRG